MTYFKTGCCDAPRKRVAAFRAALLLALLPAALLAATSAPPAAAQQQRVYVADTLLARLDARLDLTEAQSDALRPVVSEHLEQLRALAEAMQSAEGRRERRRAFKELRALQKETDARVEEVLSGEQVEAYRAFREEQREQMRRRMKQRRSGGRRS